MTWYNIVAVAMGIIFILVGDRLNKRDEGFGGAFSFLIKNMLWIFSVILFYAIWGGVFWW